MKKNKTHLQNIHDIQNTFQEQALTWGCLFDVFRLKIKRIGRLEWGLKWQKA